VHITNSLQREPQDSTQKNSSTELGNVELVIDEGRVWMHGTVQAATPSDAFTALGA